jgi:hypothetical protein
MTRPVSDAASNSHPVAVLVGYTNIPLASGKGSGGRDHSFLRLFKPGQIAVRSPGSARADQALEDGKGWFSWFSYGCGLRALQYNPGGHIFPEGN